MDIKHLLVFLATIVLIHANFTDLQTEVTETKQELHNLQILVSDLRSEQRELRQLSNDHVILHWLKNSVMDLRREMNQLAMTQQERNTAVDQRLENKMQEMRLGICRKPCTYKVLTFVHTTYMNFIPGSNIHVGVEYFPEVLLELFKITMCVFRPMAPPTPGTWP